MAGVPSKERLGQFEHFLKGRWAAAPIGAATDALVASSSSGARLVRRPPLADRSESEEEESAEDFQQPEQKRFLCKMLKIWKSDFGHVAACACGMHCR